MKKKYIVICSTVFFAVILVLIICKPTKTPKEITNFNNKLIEIVKTNSLYSDSLDWASLEKEIANISKNFKTIRQCSTCVNFILSKLRSVGDIHSFYAPMTMAHEIITTNLDSSLPEYKYLGNHIAYIKVPGIMSGNDSICNDFATQIQKFIRSMDSNSINGWIVDLRDNTGGNMYPMLAGLGPLTGEGILGYFVDKVGSMDTWSYQNGKALHNKDVVTLSATPYTIKNKNSKIAVLINDKTASSGEMTAIGFVGKQNVKIFGRPSAGYTTGNSDFVLSDSSYIYLASVRVADRNKKIYYHCIEPDVLVDDIAVNNSIGDKCLKTAERWLKENCL